MQPEELIKADLSHGRYRVVSQLGEGSMAYVYKAYDSRLDTNVVIKVPKPEKIADSEFLVRFRRESQVMVRLTHPHVVTILDVGEYRDVPFVVMQFLSGGTLKDRFAISETGDGRVSAVSLKDWIREVARALDFVHAQRIVHRDVKPANIIFDEFNNAFLSDFGLTKIMYGDHRDQNSEMTAAGFVVGTPNYVAPEIVLGEAYDGRADQYSLGITVYHALTGSPPMQGASSSATMVNQAQKQLKLLNEVCHDVPSGVALAVNRAIEKDPAARFSLCEEFADAILIGLHSSSSGSSSRVSREVRTRRPAAPVSPEGPATTAKLPPRRRSGSGVSRGQPGAVNCPACKVLLPLKPIHAGRKGKCIHCGVRLSVSDDLTTLTRVRTENSDWYVGTGGTRKKRKNRGQRSDGSGEMLLGEKIFGWEIGKKPALAIAGILLLVLLAVTVFLTIHFTGQSETEKLEQEVQGDRGIE